MGFRLRIKSEFSTHRLRASVFASKDAGNPAMLMQTELRTVSVNHAKANPIGRPAIARSAPGGIGAMETMGSHMKFGANVEIFGEGEPAEYVYKVVTGAVRTYRILSDGRRQIGGFYLPGDIFGLEIGKEHQFSAEAINGVTVLVVRRSAIVSLAEHDCEAARELWSFTGRELKRVQEHTLLLVKNAQQRVASFLLEMSKRLAATDAIELPMSRQDIADYLGLTIETVSRTMTQLVSEQAIGLPSSRRIVLRNAGALRSLNA
jgi:CRP/FNR family transcriptional regulator, nitrogen fixation regulation protein